MAKVWKKGTTRGSYDWQAPGYGRHPTIWAYKTDAGWECQFVGHQHGLTATGHTRLEASDKLMKMFLDFKERL